jgi:undecaprenyl-diphosphatase
MTSVDAAIFHALYGGLSSPSGALTWLALVLSALGGGWALVLLVPLLGLSRSRPLAIGLLATLAASTTVVFTIKALVSRARPCLALPGVRALCEAPTDPSFPSGHACGSFTFATFVLVATASGERLGLASWGQRLFRVALLVFATGVAWSRVYLGVHFPLDVTAGALLGVSIGAAGGRAYVRHVTQLARTPVVDPDCS